MLVALPGDTNQLLAVLGAVLSGAAVPHNERGAAALRSASEIPLN